MLPSAPMLLFYMLLTIVVVIVEAVVRQKNEKAGNVFLTISILAFLAFIYIDLGIPDLFIPFSIAAVTYSSLSTIIEGRRRANKRKRELETLSYEEWSFPVNYRKFTYESLLTLIVLSGAIAFYIWGPETSVLKFLSLLFIIHSLIETFKSFFIASSTQFYWTDTHEFFIISTFDSRKYPLVELEAISKYSGVDLLRIHPLFTIFTKGTDFITGSGTVIRLDFPGESLYVNNKYVEKFQEFLPKFGEESLITNKVMPLFHPSNLKRLAGKLYFAAAIKGISLYIGIFLGLYLIEAHYLIITFTIIIVWFINMYFSDVILKIATDASEVKNQNVLNAAHQIFERLNLPHITLYETDTKDYNGFAAGMGIGRSMITLTSETLKLPTDAIVGILAHEAIHVKKRDVLFSQLLRIPYILLIVAIMYPILEYTNWSEEYPIMMFIGIFLIIWLFPVYQSFYSQWMEVRADRLASMTIPGGHKQMAESLETLGKAQDEAIEQSLLYVEETDEEKNKKEKEPFPSLERSGWLFRFLEFQFMLHPPLYWRILVLQKNQSLKSSLKEWMADRFKESVRIK
ncbi:M56 family metallopeptidase [Alkalihalobacillus trypoxylicola]|uniref:Uncharacterized protein n=1 Tax=Alkalihalobacillus trypoxylicola TaxID=519424 RepID=A0A162CXP4_9BACI|nr:M56 family metallopeptidase [Alkalihalobacillus trypoxylicola]KYG27056.1 hypothetical protein AZF04_12035 [Alkalihalobacillus trypoxylicola]